MDNVETVLVDPRLVGLLAYGTAHAAAIDLRACSVSFAGAAFTPITEDASFTLFPGEQCKIGSGVQLHIGSVFGEDEESMLSDGMTAAGILLPRSGLGTKQRIRLSNTVGLVDADYQGEIIMVFENGGTEPWVIPALERVAQLAIIPVFRVGFNVVPAFTSLTVRGEGGFGSTGKQ